jgi:hypothetical protein
MKNLNKVFSFLFAIMAIFFISNLIVDNLVYGAVANITKIVFFTPERTIGSGLMSDIITIQTQNSGGIEEKIDESVNKLVMSVDSSTGQFFSNNTTAEATSTFTMSKNTVNKNFYYKDTANGTFNITAKLTSGETGKSWTATQNITIRNSSIPDPIIPPTPTSTPTTTPATTTLATTTATTTLVVTTVYSVHYISEDLSDYTEPTTFEISAGRDRLGYINSPVSFVAKNKVSKDLQNTSCDYIWNFGDGISESGGKVEHIYKYAGDYNVILNGTCGNWWAVSRTTIKIVEAKILMGKKEDGAIEISNQGQYEINLFNWKISAGNLNYTFPMDTIISAGKAVTFPAEYLKIPTASNDVILADVSGKERGKASLKTLAFGVIDSERVITVADFERFAVEYKKLTAPKNYLAVNPTTTVPSPSLTNEGKGEVNIPLAASVVDVIVSGDGSDFGFWGKLFHPVRTIKNSFYK